ncbi:hypothetical protein N8I84_38280 [Streptomyces cynarae]|uniref:ABC transporter permease n=1 Tax=Streptomyces cynarae TaxID=2981134 RepID=A0ABY6EB43_9ACTN|nr:hypothetical protein [Streptomyces cynarae]UXY23902.1 hypothetical protein N8I84_38280 [Streptomyces cynarae]
MLSDILGRLPSGAGYAAATSLQTVLTPGGPAIALASLIAIGVAVPWVEDRRGRPY